MWVLCSLTRDQTHTLCNRRRTLNHWTAREFPRWILQSVQQSLKIIHLNGIKECCNECVNGGKTNIFPSEEGSQVSLCWKGQNLFVYGQEYVPFLSVTYNSQNWKTEFKNSLVWTRHMFPLSHKFSVYSWNMIVQILVISDNSSGAFQVAQW